MFTTGGSTTVDTALRFTHFYNIRLGRPEKKIVISRERSYHGSTYLSASASGKERFTI
jgi:adenosylmethionine-8-amino-7-oxononanoate aminotransferase